MLRAASNCYRQIDHRFIPGNSFRKIKRTDTSMMSAGTQSTFSMRTKTTSMLCSPQDFVKAYRLTILELLILQVRVLCLCMYACMYVCVYVLMHAIDKCLNPKHLILQHVLD